MPKQHHDAKPRNLEITAAVLLTVCHDGRSFPSRAVILNAARSCPARVRSAARARPSAAAAIGLILAATLLGCASTTVPSAARQQSPSTASSPARDRTRTVSASRSPAIGKAYPFELLIHCGVPIVDFDRRTWQPAAPVPAYPGPRQVNGTATYTGYVAGTMTLVNARKLLFVADSSAVASPFSVVYEPLTGRVTRSPCSLPRRTGSPGAPGMNDRRRQSAAEP